MACAKNLPHLRYLLPALEVLKAMAVTLPQHGSSSSGTTAAALARPAAAFARLPGSPDTLASIQLLPQRYRRRPLVAEEMDYIQVSHSLST